MRGWAVGASCALLCLFLSGCRKPAPPPQRPPPPVTANQPTQREIIEWDEYPGRLEAVEMVEVRARVSGYLKAVQFKDGSEVKKGDLLFVIDPRPYQAELERAEAELKQAQTRLELAANELARAERLQQSKIISEEEADTRSKAKRQTEGALQAAQASVETAKLNLDYTQIKAPISGRIGRKLITEGNLVNGNQGQSTLLTTIVSLDPIYCYFDADEPAVLKYQKLAREGKRGTIGDGQVSCELGLANEDGFPHHGRLDFVDNRVDPATGTLRVRGVFTNPAPDRILQPGFFARVRVPGSAKYKALLVPELAIGTDQGQKFVYVVNDQDTVESRQVVLGRSIGSLRVVREGVRPDDWVMVNGLLSVRAGAKVKPARETAAEAAGSETPAPAGSERGLQPASAQR